MLVYGLRFAEVYTRENFYFWQSNVSSEWRVKNEEKKMSENSELVQVQTDLFAVLSVLCNWFLVVRT